MIPLVITKGDSLQWSETLSEYPASDGWVVGYNIVNENARYNVESTADGDDHLFSLASSVTNNWQPANYTFVQYVVNDPDRHTLLRGGLTVLDDLSTASDQRSNARIALDNVNAVINNRATLDQESYSIGGRSLSRMSISDLLALRDDLERQVKAEENAEKISKGFGTRATIRVRF